jgi:hypothetical protein
VGSHVSTAHKWATLALASLLAGCFSERTVTCEDRVNGETFLCPAGLACAAPGHCGDPAQVARCHGAKDWDACAFDGVDERSGSCLRGECGQCTVDRGGCFQSGWRAMTSGTGIDLYGVYVASRGEMYAAGSMRTVLEYDGLRWMATPLDAPETANITSMAGAGSFVVVCTNEGDVHARENGTWSKVGSSSQPLLAIWTSGPDNIVAVGEQGTAYRYDGIVWSEVRFVDTGTGESPTLLAVWGVSANDFFVAGNFGIIARYQEGVWSVSRQLAAGQQALRGLYGASPTQMFAVGVQGNLSPTLLHYDGTAWSAESLPNIGALDFYAVSGRGSDDVLVAGQQGTILHFDGGAWTAQSTPNLADVHALAASVDDVIAAGQGGLIWRYTP